MSKLLTVLLLAPVLTVRAFAQTPTIHEGEVTDQGPQPDKTVPGFHVWKKVIRNDSSSSIIAFHARFRCANRSTAMFDHDPFWRYGSDAALPPGKTLEIVAADPSQCNGGVVAAVFADGHCEGETQEIDDIYARRRGVYKALGESIKLLDAITAQQKTPSDVIEILKSRQSALSYDQTIDGAERRGMDAVFGPLRLILRSTNREISITSDRTAYRQPTYAELAKSKNISVEQAQAIVMAKKYQEWQAYMEGHMERPQSCK